jgi:hypothetical protein
MPSTSVPKKTSKASGRPTFSPVTVLALCAQVNRVCPKCGKPLFIKKGTRSVKDYEIAHIYPLNPTSAELELLKSESKLSDDPNDELNLIPLCFTCHKIYDTGKTVADYRELKKIKERLTSNTAQLRVFYEFQIESEIVEIIGALMTEVDADMFDATYVAKDVDAKLRGNILPLTKRKIKNDVSSFYLFIRDQLTEIERRTPTQGMLIAQQVKTFYLKQKALGYGQQEIYQNVVRWILTKSPAGADEAAAALAAFFVQNCEIFE